MNQYLNLFKEIESETAEETKQKHFLIMNAYLDSQYNAVVLKLFKDNWVANDDKGVFFSIWVDKKGLKQQRVAYNIHAIKIATLPQYSLKAREFATSFRKKVSTKIKKWPDISVDFGPQTLMQGYIESDLNCVKKNVFSLIDQFFHIYPTIDILLKENKNLR